MTDLDIDPKQPWSKSRVKTVVDQLCTTVPDALAVVGVDGHSGSGKSTVASALAAAHPRAAVVRTDDLAWHHSFFGWDQLLIEHILQPLRRTGPPVSHRPRAWTDRKRHGAISIPSATTLVIVEGVGACRNSLRPWYDATIWVHASASIASQRVIDRGADTTQFIADWMAQENALMSEEQPWARADVYVCGTRGGHGASGQLASVFTAPGPRMVRGPSE